jgi:hypothetical protein
VLCGVPFILAERGKAVRRDRGKARNKMTQKNIDPARSKAEARFAATLKREAQMRTEREKAEDKRNERTARLRELRLAKEAADREAAEQAAAEKAAGKAAAKSKSARKKVGA